MARTTSSLQFYCRSSKANKQGLAPLELSIILNGSRRFINLPSKFSPVEFNKKRPMATITETVDLWRTKINTFINEMMLNNIPITLSMAEEALKDMISPHKEKEITPELILQVVCEHYGINDQAVLSSKKTKDISMVRQIIMYLCRECINDMSLKNIAEFLGKKDHTTIMHGISKVEYVDGKLVFTLEIKIRSFPSCVH